jgi:hypothetical protein
MTRSVRARSYVRRRRHFRDRMGTARAVELAQSAKLVCARLCLPYTGRDLTETWSRRTHSAAFGLEARVLTS